MPSNYSKTGIIYNNPLGNIYTNKIKGVVPFYYRSRNCDSNMTSITPANKYQTQKIIQNTVRVPSSLYTMNLSALNVYDNKKNTLTKTKTNWNQMSDRSIPSIQRAGRGPANKPGYQTPGGIGCDIKHNSYNRYLNRIKGKGPVRRDVLDKSIIPIFGNKVLKHNIISHCNCPQELINDDADIFAYQNQNQNQNQYQQLSPSCIFNIGDVVFARKTPETVLIKANIIAQNNNTYIIQYEEDNSTQTKYCNELYIWNPCIKINTCSKLYTQVNEQSKDLNKPLLAPKQSVNYESMYNQSIDELNLLKNSLDTGVETNLNETTLEIDNYKKLLEEEKSERKKIENLIIRVSDSVSDNLNKNE
jgi:hypothetical protein